MLESIKRKVPYFIEFARHGEVLNILNSLLLLFELQPFGRDRIIHRSFGNLFVRGGTTDYLYASEAWEQMTLSWIMRQRDIKQLIIVGACIGEWPVKLAALGIKRIMQLEPEPSSYRSLLINSTLNSINSINLQVAASDKSGAAAIRQQRVNRGSATLEDGSDQRDARVQVVTLDEIIPRHGFDATASTLVMVDAEGHDLRVLAGMRNILMLYERVAVILEYSREEGAIESFRNAFGFDYTQQVLDKDNCVFTKGVWT